MPEEKEIIDFKYIKKIIILENEDLLLIYLIEYIKNDPTEIKQLGKKG